jgi:hypothetical protein
MNAHVKPTRRGRPELTPEKKLIADAGKMIAFAYDLGACRCDAEANEWADSLEGMARGYAAAAVTGSNDLDEMFALEQAGDCSRRARLWRARARELRGPGEIGELQR